jgi:ubiquinone/menaquinone biosynthesis C-methylase UbiE
MLSQNEVKAFYDQFGAKQDGQGFYEDVATGALLEHGHFDQAQAVFEYGMGTGRFAEKLLSEYLPASCRYFGTDISSTMVELATQHLHCWADRSTLQLSNGAVKLAVQDAQYDRFVCNYVLDLMSRQDAVALVQEAHRILTPGGLLCLVSLTHGKTWLTRGISSAWNALYRIRPKLVGGCRPIESLDYVLPADWEMEYHAKVSACGISSEIDVARRLARQLQAPKDVRRPQAVP